MAWLFKADWVASPRPPVAADLDNIAKDIRTWGGGVDAAQNSLSNLGVLTFAAGGYVSDRMAVRATAGSTDDASQRLVVSVNNLYGFITPNDSASPKYVDIGAYEAGVGWKNIALARGGGNVGIGTESPLVRAHVAADDYRQMYLTGASVPTSQMRLGYDVSNNTGVVEVLMNGAARPLLLNPSGGNVGICTDADYAAKLAINMGGSRFYLRRGVGLSGGWAHRVDVNGTYQLAYEDDAGGVVGGAVALKYSYDGYLSVLLQSAGADAFLNNNHGQIFVDEGGKTVYMRYKDSGGVCHSVPLGSWT